MARDRYQFVENGQPHFITMTVVNWLPVFSSRATAEILLDSLRYLQEQGRMTLYAYVITGCQKWNNARLGAERPFPLPRRAWERA